MSTGSMQTNGSGCHFQSKVANIRCPADAILNGFKAEFENEHCEPKTKNYKSIVEYCNEVADELPQRQAFYAIDLADVLWKVQEWKRRLPNVEIFYAVKANTDPVLLKLLCILGLSFDCASAEEIQMALNAGAPSSNIIYAHTIKPEEELKFASEKGVAVMTFDNEDELLKIHRVCPKAKLVIRLIPSNVSCSFDLSEKFGCSPDEAIRLLKLAKKLGLAVVGVSFHVGALCDDPQSYSSTISTCRKLFDEAQRMGFDFTILDIGGGFFGHSGTEGIFNKMAESINEALKDNFGDREKVRIIAEPGTYIVGSAFRLICTVIGRRCFAEAAVKGRPRRDYYLNDGIYGSFFRDIELYGIRPVPLLPDSELKSRDNHECRIFGQTCCSEDVIRRSVTLPDLNVGERLMWENMGAYSLGVSSTFCGTPLPVPRYMFVRDNRLKLDWIHTETAAEISQFLKKHATFIGDEKSSNNSSAMK